jgi:UPF0716 family protein affecting phage T7 exclusion
MTLDRKLHIVAISLLGAAIVVGVALLFVVVGMYFASRAGIEQRRREHPED